MAAEGPFKARSYFSAQHACCAVVLPSCVNGIQEDVSPKSPCGTTQKPLHEQQVQVSATLSPPPEKHVITGRVMAQSLILTP